MNYVRKIPGLLCATACVACLSPGLFGMGQWGWLAGGLLVFAAWLGAYGWSSVGLATLALMISIGLAAVGLVSGATPLWMLVGAALALASWDLLQLDHDLRSCAPSDATRLCEKRHYESLVLALGAGLLAALGGRLLRLQLSFGVIIILVVAALFSLDRFWRVVEKKV
jgi:hypothetical protein